MFRDCLNPEIKDTLAAHNIYFDELEPFIRYCNGLDRSIYDRRVERGNSYSGNYGNSNRSETFSRPHQNPPQSFGRPPRPYQYSTQGSTQSVPMELDAIYTMDSRGYKHLTPEEKTRRKELNLCLYCGESGHDFTKCPKKGSKKVNSIEISSVRFMDSVSEGSIFVDILMQGNGAEIKAKALLDSGAKHVSVLRGSPQ
jgi:hypothetical protein